MLMFESACSPWCEHLEYTELDCAVCLKFMEYLNCATNRGVVVPISCNECYRRRHKDAKWEELE